MERVLKKKPVLVVMAAGMGSRYGGLKQVDPVGSCGEVIMDYSLFDARRAGFERVIFVIKHSIEEIFREKIGNRLENYMQVQYAFRISLICRKATPCRRAGSSLGVPAMRFWRRAISLMLPLL